MSGRPQPVGGWGCAGGGMGNTSMVDGVACGFVRLSWLWVPACACVWVGACCRVLGRCALVVACVACASSGVWRGVGCGGWVGCDLYSGREHHLIVFMRGMPGDR